jgi:hypothetical protein
MPLACIHGGWSNSSIIQNSCEMDVDFYSGKGIFQRERDQQMRFASESFEDPETLMIICPFAPPK